MALTLSLAHADSQDVDADALLVPVDGAICRLGGAAANALRAALPAAERADELAFLADELLAMRPLADGEARVVADVARWRWLVVSAAYPHDVDGHMFTPAICAARLRVAMPRAFEVAVAAGASSIAITVIGTAYRIPGDLAVRAQADAIAAARALSLHVWWTFRETALLDEAKAAATRLGLLA